MVSVNWLHDVGTGDMKKGCKLVRTDSEIPEKTVFPVGKLSKNGETLARSPTNTGGVPIYKY